MPSRAHLTVRFWRRAGDAFEHPPNTPVTGLSCGARIAPAPISQRFQWITRSSRVMTGYGGLSESTEPRGLALAGQQQLVNQCCWEQSKPPLTAWLMNSVDRRLIGTFRKSVMPGSDRASTMPRRAHLTVRFWR